MSVFIKNIISQTLNHHHHCSLLRPQFRLISEFSLFRADKPDNHSVKPKPRKHLPIPFLGTENPSATKGSGTDNKIQERQKEFPRDAKLLVKHFYNIGYLDDHGFSHKNGDDDLDFSCFDSDLGREFIVSAAELFGKDNQKITEWLPRDDMKIMLHIGCPSLASNYVFAAKRLRMFFNIPEDQVCGGCPLNKTCKFVNLDTWKPDTKNLVLSDVMILITQYSLDSLPPKLSVPAEMKGSISRLVNQVIRFTRHLAQRKQVLP